MHLHLCISFARIKRTILHTKAAPKRSDFSVPLLMQKIECLRREEENDGLNNREYPQEYLVISKEIWKIYGLRVYISLTLIKKFQYPGIVKCLWHLWTMSKSESNLENYAIYVLMQIYASSICMAHWEKRQCIALNHFLLVSKPF